MSDPERGATNSGSGSVTGSMPHRSPGTIGAFNPTFSPDGNRIAYSAGGNVQLKIVSVTGGPPITLSEPGSGAGGGNAWGPDGWIYFDSPNGLSRVRADGGAPELFVPYDTVAGEIGHAWPNALPNGKGLLYRSRVNLDPTDFDIVAFDFKTRERHVLTKGLLARYVEPGYLVYLRADGAVLAAPFDQDQFKLTGPAAPLLEGVMTKPFGSADFAISTTGTLVYVPGLASNAGGVAELVYVSRDGVDHAAQSAAHLEPFGQCGPQPFAGREPGRPGRDRGGLAGHLGQAAPRRLLLPPDF